LVELLVVIAVIAIIAAIAIPNIAGITGAANQSKNQRNAQNLASVYNSAVAAGYANTAVTDELTAATALVNGITNGGATFRVDGLSTQNINDAIGYLDVSGTSPNITLIYKQTTN